MAAQKQKWIGDVAPDEPAHAVAERSLAARLKAVRRALPDAARRADEDVEYVHDLRVSVRRATAALTLYWDFLPRKRADWFKKQLKRVRDATDEARDLDILAARIAAEQARPEAAAVLHELQALRAEAQRALIAYDKQLTRRRRLKKRTRDLLASVRPRGKRPRDTQDPPFELFARRSLRPILEKFFDAAQFDPADVQALHRFRIRGKKLRYAMELLAAAFPAEFRERIYPIVERLQDKLGEINDHVAARQYLSRWLADADNPNTADFLEELLEAEFDSLDAARRNFVRWWTPEFADRLQQQFDKLLAPNEAESRGHVQVGAH